MRRRRQKNPLLMRIIVVSVAVHIVALPVLAHFGAFKKIQERFVEAKIVVLPPPDRPKLEKQQIKQAAKRAPVVAKRGHSAPHSQGSKPNPNQVHIAMAAGKGAGDGEPGAQQGTLQQGVVPPDTSAGKTGLTVTPPPPAVTPKETVTAPANTAPVITKTEPIVKPVAPVVAPAPHEPMFAEASPIDGRQPQPTIPDDIRLDSLDATVVVDLTVGPDGVPAQAAISQSTGKRALDGLALDAAKQWRFRPATRDGEPVESHVRLHFEFQVR